MNLHDEFTRRVAADRLCRELARAIAENDTAALERLGMKGFGRYAGRLAELMTDSVREGLDWSTDFAALMRQVNSPVRYAHHLVNECGTAVQTALDERNGVRLRVVEPEFNDGRLKGIVGEASESDSGNAADNLAVQLGTMTKDAGNEFMRQNAEQRDRAGFKVTITRTGGAKCCPWCADRTGKWELANAPDGVFGCHDNCKCMVDYTNSKGAVSRRTGRGRFVDVPYEPPHVLSREEAREKGGFSQPRRLTGAANGGIIDLDMFRTRDDPMREVLGSAYENNREELFKIIDELEAKGVEILISDRNRTMGYQPGVSLSNPSPGQIKMDREASISAWRHERRHALDDEASGWLGRLLLADPNTRYEWEKRAYAEEIELANQLNRPDMVERLNMLLEEERRKIYGK